jgi:glycosyltransferase involved in cell wall biosynthesis
MNVLFYIPALTRAYGGIYQYTIGLLNSLGKSNCNYYIYCLEPDNDLKELVAKFPNLQFVEPGLMQRNKWSAFKFKVVCFFNNLFKKFFNATFSDKDFLFDLIAEKYAIDVTHCPYTLYFKHKNIPNISTLHDVQELHFPAFFTSEQRASRAVNNKYIIDNSNAVIVSYNHIKNDIVSLFAKPEQQVFVSLIDMKNLWFEKYLNSVPIPLGGAIPEHFIFYPAVMWQHKNHLNLIKSLAWLRDQKGITVNLIFTGDHKIPFADTVKRLIEELKLNNQIQILGIVNDETLYALYQKCTAVVVPTLYEAGSFPLMEAILMEHHVICSNVTSLPETIGDNQFVFDPQNIAEIAQKIERICFDNEYRTDNLRRIKLQQARLKDTGITPKVEAIYSELIKNKIIN